MYVCVCLCVCIAFCLSSFSLSFCLVFFSVYFRRCIPHMCVDGGDLNHHHVDDSEELRRIEIDEYFPAGDVPSVLQALCVFVLCRRI